MATYSFLEVNCAIVGPGGAFSIGSGSGNSEEGISIEASEEIDAMQIGADGTPMHSLRANRSGKVVVSLLKTSPTNALLMALYNAQTAAAALHGNNVITLSDINRGDTITCQQVAFARAPTLAYAKDGGMNQWEFNAGIITRVLGSGG